MQKVVSNSSPLIQLAKLNKLNLLKDYFQKIFIPESVYNECTIEGKGRDEIKLIKAADWIEVIRTENKNLVSLLMMDLDFGESEAIALASEIGADLILLDDFEAREKARALNLNLTGVVGILLRAKMDGKLESLTETFQKLKNNGLWISDHLLHRILVEVGEA